MKHQIERECPVCGVVYHANPGRLKWGRETTCSRACSYQARADKKRCSQELECATCGAVFYRVPSHIKSRHGEVFCSRPCAHRRRKRIVERPYVLVSDYDRQAAAQKAWRTRRANPRPYSELAREKSRARAIARLQRGFAVSQFEREAAQVFRRLGFNIRTSVPIRGAKGRYAAVFDICLPARRLFIECHGTYWHGGRWTWETPDATQAKNLKREEVKVALARHQGSQVRLLWEHDFKRDPVGTCLAAAR